MYIWKILTWLWLGLQTGGTEYTKFETENVTRYRKAYNFETGEVATNNDGRRVEMWTSTNPDSLEVFYYLGRDLERLIELQMRTIQTEGPGYRIQVYAGSNLDNSNRVRTDFIQEFDEIPVYQTWDPPHFRVRVGDFLTHSDAMYYLAEIRSIFPGAFVVDEAKVKYPRYHEEEEEEGKQDLREDRDGME